MPIVENLDQVRKGLPTVEQVDTLFAYMFALIEVALEVQPYAYGMPLVHTAKLARNIVEDKDEDVFEVIRRIWMGATVLE